MAAARPVAVFKIGDVVQLKSGGPDMTVTGVDETPYGGTRIYIDTTWFSGKKNEKGRFPQETLRPSGDDKKKS